MYQSLIHEDNIENCLFKENNAVLNGKNIEGKLCIKRESNILDLIISVYLCYDEHKAPSICNTTIYLSNLILTQCTTRFLNILFQQATFQDVWYLDWIFFFYENINADKLSFKNNQLLMCTYKIED